MNKSGREAPQPGKFITYYLESSGSMETDTKNHSIGVHSTETGITGTAFSIPGDKVSAHIPNSFKDIGNTLETEGNGKALSIYSDSNARAPVPDGPLRIRDFLRRQSYSSSLISDIQSVLNIRFSISTATTSSYCSASMISVMQRDKDKNTLASEPKSGLPPSVTLEFHRQQVQVANTALIDMCCSKNADCVHRYIKAATVSGLSNGSQILDHSLSSCPIVTKMDPDIISGVMDHPYGHQINRFDKYGNNTLFFAARSGAPLDVLLTILRRTVNINALNEDGQTFLFMLDPHPSSYGRCYCSNLLAGYHTSGFQCLLTLLEERRFDFSHIDHNGRHFLFYLCASPLFDENWLLRLLDHDQSWKTKMGNLGRLRDSSGAAFRDFLSLNPNNQSLIGHFPGRIGFPFEKSMRTTDAHEILLSKEFQRASTLREIVRAKNTLHPDTHLDIRRNINNYNRQGRTPVMEYLYKMLDANCNEAAIVSKLRDIHSYHANFNARSRDGSNVLHIAAEKSCATVIEYLLSVGVQVDHRNNAGFSPLDYAARNFDRSRNANESPQITAQSLKSVTRLLNYALAGFSKFKPSERITQKNLNDAAKTAERSLQSMEKLQNRSAQLK